MPPGYLPSASLPTQIQQRVFPFLLRVKGPEYVNVASREKRFKTRSFLRLKQRFLRRVLLVLRVNVADTNSAAGIDGVKLTSDAQKMKMALSLTRRGYQPLPNRYEKVTERGKELTLHIPAARDKAMLVLYSFSLDPVAESTADKKSFFARKGRSAHDAYAYILRELNQENPPKLIVRADVAAFFDTKPPAYPA